MKNNDNNGGDRGTSLGMCIGLALGTAIGAATGNIGLWMPVGLCLGLVLGPSLFDQKEEEDPQDKDEKMTAKTDQMRLESTIGAFS